MTFPPDLPASFAERAAAAGLRAEDVDEHFILGTGHGGQRRNKRSTTVQLVHHPSGTEIRARSEREQHQNRVDAWERLLAVLEEKQRKTLQEKTRADRAKRVQKKRRSPGGQAAVLEEKRFRGDLKRGRSPMRGFSAAR